VSAALRALLEGAIDYAGLFPPAALPMADAAANYDHYRAGPNAWALGRFVVPATRLREFADVASARWPRGETASPWRVSAILPGADLETEVDQVADFDARHGRSGGIVPDGQRGGAWIDTVELRAETPTFVARIAEVVPRSLDTYVEVPVSGDPEPLVRAIADGGLKAKMRTGALTADAIPSAAQVARFLACCAACRVPFKATAGLHHPIRAAYRLTYAPDAPSGEMFGFVNLLVASAFARERVGQDELVALLEEREPGAFAFDDAGLAWRGRRLGVDALRAAHSDLARAFGSCSFTEPIDEAQALGFL